MELGTIYSDEWKAYDGLVNAGLRAAINKVREVNMNVIFILKSGIEKRCDFSEGETILKVAEENEVPISSFCEGFGVCGACHVIIENLLEKLPPISEHENAALDRANGVTEHSRLACQVQLSKELDGLRIKLV